MMTSNATTVKNSENDLVLLIVRVPLQGSAALCALHQGDQMFWK